MNINRLALLNLKETQSLLLTLSRDEFALAIKSANKKLCDKWYTCISERAQEMIHEDHRRMCDITTSDINKAVAAVFSHLREEVRTGRLTLRPSVKRALTRQLELTL
jgi:flagellar motor switch protein FliG